MWQAMNTLEFTLLTCIQLCTKKFKFQQLENLLFSEGFVSPLSNVPTNSQNPIHYFLWKPLHISYFWKEIAQVNNTLIEKGLACNINKISLNIKACSEFGTTNLLFCTCLYEIQYVIIVCRNICLIIFQKVYFIIPLQIGAKCH